MKEMHEVKTCLEQQVEHSEERFDWLVERVLDIAEKLGPDAWHVHFKAIEARCHGLRRSVRLSARWTSAARPEEKLENVLLETLRLTE
jgi:hypothetical protein